MTKKTNNCNVICFSNHKGGVAKTSSTTNVGAGLASLGYKCLIIDLDPQANLSISLGIKAPEFTIYGCLRDYFGLDQATFLLEPNLYIVPANLDLSGAEIELSAEAGREFILKGLIDTVRDKYDYIFLDCPPSLGLLTVNAFTAADNIIIPVQPEFLAVQGLTLLIETIKKIRQRLNKNLSIAGVLITQYDNRKTLNREVYQALKKHYPTELFKTKIRDNISLAEAPSQSTHIFKYKPKCHGAADYKALCKELIKRSKKPLATKQG